MSGLAGPVVGGMAITGITSDSRQAGPGMLFAALPGAKADGRDFIAEAVARGAAAVLAPEGTEWPPGVPPRPFITDREPRLLLARLAARHAGVQPETVVAVTGTNGKTSTAEFIRQLFADAGRPAASLGTLGTVAPGHVPSAGLTTPGPVELSRTLAGLAREGVQVAALEASSHGLDQFRLDGVRLRAAGFTNLTRDHLDYHGSMDAYRAAKLRLFDELLPEGAPAVIDAALDDATAGALAAIARRRRLCLRTVGEAGSFVRLHGVRALAGGQVLDVEHGGVRRTVELPLPGRFQADNALLAAALAISVGLPNALDRLPRLSGVRGRMERAAVLPNGAVVYVDFAHTPDALTRLLAALRPHATGRLHLLFGAGGDRDPGKRPLMGAAARAADVVLVTDDNPRNEDPAVIRAAVLAGCPNAREIAGRAEAIAAAITALKPGDVLAVAGKGHENGQTIRGVTHPFDDADTVRRLVP